MEQDTLSLRTKIVAKFMTITGILIILQSIFVFVDIIIEASLTGYTLDKNSIFIGLINILFNYTFFVAVLFILFSIFLRKRKKWAWVAAIVLLSKEVIIGIEFIFVFFINFSGQISYLKELQATIPTSILTLLIIATIISVLIYILVSISLIFLIKDRKNYWQFAL